MLSAARAWVQPLPGEGTKILGDEAPPSLKKEKKVKKRPKEWKNISTNHTSDKGLVSKKYQRTLTMW